MELGLDAFLLQVWQSLQGFGGLSFLAKISAIVLLIIASMKVSALKPVWDKLGVYKAFAAPVLSLIVGIVSLLIDSPFSWANLAAYLIAGSGAIILHEVLDGIKGLPGVGGIYLKIIDLVQGLLKKKV